MKVTFSIDNDHYELRPITLQDHWVFQTELILNENPGFYIVSYLSGCPESTLRELTLEQWDKIWSATQKFLEEQNERKRKATQIITLNGVEYGLVNFDSMSIGEFADLDLLMNSPDLESKINQVMAILYRPVISKDKSGRFEIEPYNLESFTTRSEEFKSLLISDVRTALAFFLSFVLQYTEAILNSLEIQEEMTEMIPALKEIIQNQVSQLEELGIRPYLLSPAEIFLTSTEQADEESGKHLTFSLIKNRKRKSNNWNFKKLIKNINFN